MTGVQKCTTRWMYLRGTYRSTKRMSFFMGRLFFFERFGGFLLGLAEFFLAQESDAEIDDHSHAADHTELDKLSEHAFVFFTLIFRFASSRR